MLDSEMIAAWRAAARELGIEVLAPHTVTLPGGVAVEVEAFLPDFGGPNGAVAVALADDERFRLLAGTRHIVSRLADHYRGFERKLFQATLDDWGWFGPTARRPAWFTGKPWS
jgi:hypothetical protein